MMKTLPTLAAIPVLLAIVCCSRGEPAADGTTAAPGHERHWSYETAGDAVGPEGWGSLPGDATCATGTTQSPVALSSSSAVPTDKRLSFAYAPTALRVTNNGHTQQVDAGAGSHLELDGESFPLLQLHFHAPSEHTLDGKRYPMELHLVHAGADGRPAVVVGVLIDTGAASGPLAPVFANLPTTKGTAVPAGRTIDPALILPASRTFLHYGGSLTTPPCSEGVRWFVLKTPITASAQQVEAYVASGLDGTNRPLQPVGERTLYAGGAP
jgi:carbonic anhydrase